MADINKTTDPLQEARETLLDVEGSLLGFWTDIPETEVIRLQQRIRKTLGAFEPSQN